MKSREHRFAYMFGLKLFQICRWTLQLLLVVAERARCVDSDVSQNKQRLTYQRNLFRHSPLEDVNTIASRTDSFQLLLLR